MTPEAEAEFTLGVDRPELVARCVRPGFDSDKLKVGAAKDKLVAEIRSDSLSNLRGLTNSLLKLVKLSQKLAVGGGETKNQ